MTRKRMIYIFFAAAVTAFLMLAGCAGPRVAEHQAEAARLRDIVAQAKRLLRENGSSTPETMSLASLRALDRVLIYTDQVKADPNRFDPEKIAFYSDQIDIINANIERFKDPRYTVTLTFAPGAYRWLELSPEEKMKCQAMADRIVRTVMGLFNRRPDRPTRITLKAVGFTDEMPIVSQTLRKAVLARVDVQSRPETEFSALYNDALSALRADAISRRMIRRLRAAVPADADVRYVENRVGMGESLPPTPNPSPPYEPEDPRRRICILTAYIETLL